MKDEDFSFGEGVAVGTVRYLVDNKFGVYGRVLTQQELSPILNALETFGRAKKVGKLGMAPVWKLELEGSLNFEKVE
jgi:hypothetical protein